MKSQEYTYNLPDDYTFKPETRSKLDALVEKTGISNEDAQAFIDIHVELMEEYAAGLASLPADDLIETKESTNG